MIPYGRHSVSKSDIESVVATLESDYLTQGTQVPLFEDKLARYCGFQYAVAFNSATSGLHSACLALGVSQETKVWVPAISFVATANCAEYCGAKVSFVDIDVETGSISIESLTAKLEIAERNGCLPDVLVVVHYAGHFCDLASLARLRDRYGFEIVEDASHALGAELPNSWGEEVRGSLVVFSFHPVKMITSAEGGAVVTNNPILARRLRLFGNHGIERNQSCFVNETDGPWYYEQQLLGFNYRMSDMHAALGISQLDRLDEFLAARRAIAAFYQEELSHLSIDYVSQNTHGKSSFHLFCILAPEERAKDWFMELRSAGIGTQKHYIPIPCQPYYQRKYQVGRHELPNSCLFYKRVMALPIFPELTTLEQKQVVSGLELLC